MKLLEAVTAYRALQAISNKELGFDASKQVATCMEKLEPVNEDFTKKQRELLVKLGTKDEESTVETYKFADDENREIYMKDITDYLDGPANVACGLMESTLKDLPFLTPTLYKQLKPILM